MILLGIIIWYTIAGAMEIMSGYKRNKEDDVTTYFLILLSHFIISVYAIFIQLKQLK